MLLQTNNWSKAGWFFQEQTFSGSSHLLSIAHPNHLSHQSIKSPSSYQIISISPLSWNPESIMSILRKEERERGERNLETRIGHKKT